MTSFGWTLALLADPLRAGWLPVPLPCGRDRVVTVGGWE